jgi:hypothetical protein
MKRIGAFLAVTSILSIVLSACGADEPSPTSPSSNGSSSPTATAPIPSTTPPQAAGTVSPWSSEPMEVNRSVAVPPVPELLAIRSAAHPNEGFDRITFDFRDTLPGYEVRYVSEVIADGSGQPVNVPGRQHLEIVFRPAQAHNDAGTAAVTPDSMSLDYPMMRAYAITGDFEAVLTVVVGLDDVVGYRVGELPGQPGRIYVDVAA